MLKKIIVTLPIAFLLLACTANGNKTIAIYVTPYYNSDPLVVNVGKYSDRLKTSSAKSLLKLSDEIRQEVDEVSIQTLAVLAIRLYDAGAKDEAAYWFYTAQFRKNVFILMQAGHKGGLGDPAFEIPHALQAFKDLSGKYINGYAFGNPDKLVTLLRRVVSECKQMGYIQKAYPYLTFKPEEEQAAIIARGVESIEEDMIKYIIENKEEILRQRKENGMEGLY